MNISGKTSILGIIGDPINHVLSPLIHNTLFEALDLDWVYIPFNVKKDNLQEALNGLKTLNIKGFNVTIPHKVKIIPLLDKVEESAKIIGAVNTVKIENNQSIGRNTDAEGAIQALKEANINFHQEQIVIFGAGGAARALIFGLLPFCSNIKIVNRNQSRLNILLSDINRIYPDKAKGIPLVNQNELRRVIQSSNLLINTTSVGMYPNFNESIIPKTYLHPKCSVFDVVYSPINTKLLKDATSLGCKTLNGVNMLVNQGAIAFKWWTGKEPNKEIMKNVIMTKLVK